MNTVTLTQANGDSVDESTIAILTRACIELIGALELNGRRELIIGGREVVDREARQEQDQQCIRSRHDAADDPTGSC